MGNMGYCRFRNTARDLEDCVEHWEDDPRVRAALPGQRLDDNREEKQARDRIAKLAQQIVDMGE